MFSSTLDRFGNNIFTQVRKLLDQSPGPGCYDITEKS